MRGAFIAIEGPDGSGKGTQFRLLTDRLRNAGYDILTYDFPRYDQPSSYFVHGYLNGLYGTSEEVGPYVSSLFYAVDRYETAPSIRQALEDGKTVLVNRFTPSNMAHHGAKIDDDDERQGFFAWVDNLEYKMMAIPRPNLSIVLRVPADTARTLIDKKTRRDYATKKLDIHEEDMDHLKRSVQMYDDLCQLYPSDFKRIDCVRGGDLLEIEAIHKLLWETVKPMLPNKGQARLRRRPQIATRPNPYIERINDGYRLTTAGRGLLQSIVTDTKDGVYGLTNRLSLPDMVSVMAKFAKSEDDLRTIILDRFTPDVDNEMPQAGTRRGDDPAKDMVATHMQVEGASSLLAQKVENGISAGYLERPTRYIAYEQKDQAGAYKYYVPEYLDDNTKHNYVSIMDQIFDTYSYMLTKLVSHTGSTDEQKGAADQDDIHAYAHEVLSSVLPVAAKTTMAIRASIQSLQELIISLLSDELSEAFETGRKLLAHAQRLMPAFMDGVDASKQNASSITYRANNAKVMRKLAQDYLPAGHGNAADAAVLTSVWPKNELELLAEMLYEHSDMPLRSIQTELARWTYDRKQEAFQRYIGERPSNRHKPGRALASAHYSWDIVCEYGIFRDFQRRGVAGTPEWQHLTPRHGYDVPAVIEEAGLEDGYQQCFDLSLKLYSILQQAGYPLEAQYATLMGHKVRWKTTQNALEAFHMCELPVDVRGRPEYRDLMLRMHEKLTEVHPILAASMKFVNGREDSANSHIAEIGKRVQATSS